MPTKFADKNKSLNPADDMWADKLAADLSSLEAVGSPDEDAAVERAKSGDQVDDSDNSDIDQQDAAEAVRDQEKNSDANWRTRVENRKKMTERGNMMARFLPGSKGSKGATAGIIGLLFGGAFGGSMILAGPMTLLANLHDIASNHTSPGQHIYTKFGNSYMRAFFAGKDRDCTGKIGCKFKNITESRKKQLENRGFKVSTAPSRVPGLLKLQKLEFTEGNKTTVVDTRRKFQNLKYTHFTMFAQFQRIPLLTQFLNPTAAINNALKRFGINLADKLRSSKDPDKKARAEANKKAFNEKVGATGDADKDAEARKKRVSDAGKAEADKIHTKMSKFSNALKTSAGFAQWPALTGCILYDTIRAAKGAMMVAWHAELLKFMAPFASAMAMAKEGDIDWETAEMFGDRLMRPVTEEDVKNNPDLYTTDMIGKTSMDSKAFAAALNGDAATIEGTYADIFTSWSPADDVIGSGVIDKVRELMPGGHQTIKLACKGIIYSMLLMFRGCLKGKWTILLCAASAAAQWGLLQAFGDDLLHWAVDILSGPALKQIAKAQLDEDLHGPALGEAVIGAMGVMGGYKNIASAFPVATDVNAIKTSYTNMLTDKDYVDEQVAYAKAEAAKNQFDPSNKHSFVGQILSRVGSITGDGTLFSVIANIPHMVSLNTLFESTAHATKEGIFQPIQVYQSQKSIEASVANCKDPALLGDDIGIDIPGMGESCQLTPVIPQTVQDCLNAERDNDEVVCIDKAIEYLSTNKYTDPGDNFAQKPYIDGETGIPTGFEEFSDTEEKDFANPLMMYWQYCGKRLMPPGYTNKSSAVTILDKIDIWDEIKEGLGIGGGGGGVLGQIGGAATDGAAQELYDTFLAPNDEWYDYAYCGDGNWSSTTFGNPEAYAWMAYYVSQCIMHASMEGLNYCWDDAPASTPLTGGGDWVAPVIGVCGDGLGAGRNHQGLDIAASAGTPLVAPTDLRVVGEQTEAQNPGGGNTLIMASEDGSGYGFIFMHMQSMSPLSVGDVVKKGSPVGVVGNTGVSSGPHLHIEVYPPGVDPNSFAGEVDPIEAFRLNGGNLC